MGRHLLWRTILIFHLVAFHVSADEKSETVRKGTAFLMEISLDSETIKQGHTGTRYPYLLNHPSLIPYILDELERLKPQGSRKAFYQSLERSLIYRTEISRILNEKGLPPEILFLPLVESAFRIDAVSRSEATGLWQFKDNSTEEFGLVINEWIDERFDFVESTRAAAEKLLHNYKKTGDWFLAIAAYNCGLGALNRAIDKTGTRNYWELCRQKAIPKQTRDYIPRLLAINWVIHSKKEAGLDFSWNAPVEWVHLEVNGPSIALDLLASLSETDPELFYLGNAALLQGVTPPDKPYTLKVPSDSAETVVALLKKEGILVTRIDSSSLSKNRQSANSLIHGGMLSLSGSVQELFP